AGTKARVQNPASGISCDCEILDQPVFGNRESGSDNLAIGLKNGRTCLVEVVIAKVGAHFSGGTESRVDRAIAQITRRGKVIEVCRIFRGANCDKFAVRLHENGKGVVVETVKIGCDLSVAVESGVGRSIRIITRKREVSVRVVLGRKINEVSSGGDNLAIRLQGYGKGVAALPGKSRRNDTALAKGIIERSIRVVTDDLEIAEKCKQRKGAACDHDFAVRLDDYR